MTYQENQILKGNGFLIEKNFAIPNGGSLFVLIDYSAFVTTPGQKGVVFVYPPNLSTTAGTVIVQIYRGTDYSGGEQFYAINPNTTSKKRVSGTRFSQNPTGSVKGTLVVEYIVGGGGTEGGRSTPGETSGLAFFVQKNTGKTLIEVINESGAAIKTHYGQIIVEL
jgi:hypothetical protein